MIDENKLIEVLKDKMLRMEFDERDESYNFGIDLAIFYAQTQPKAGEWIPVEERLPKQWEPVLVTYINVFNEFLCDDCAMINENGNWIWCFDESLVELQIIAWQSLPKPYEVRENERP